MHSSYTDSRKIFGIFRQRILGDTDLKSQFEAAVVMLRSAYDAAIYENRFIVGGGIEHLTVGAFNGAGLPAHHMGRGDTRIDLIAQGPEVKGAGFSVKASFSTFNARMINTLGETVPIWQEPTLFLFKGIGMVYADPEILPDATTHSKDALLMDGKKLHEFINKNPDCVIPMNFDPPSRGKIASSKTASEEVARSIVKNFSRLSLP